MLERDGYLCQIALQEGRVEAASEVDHIVPKAEGGSDDMENLQAVSERHHRAKTQTEAARGAGGVSRKSDPKPS